MEFVPFVFADCVIALLVRPDVVKDKLKRNVWQRAASTNFNNRVHACLNFGYDRNGWSYTILLTCADGSTWREVSFTGLESVDKRYLYIRHLNVNRHAQSNQVSFAEIEKIAKFTSPHVFMAQIDFMNGPPEHQYFTLLSYYRNASIIDLSVSGNIDFQRDFFEQQMRSPFLEQIFFLQAKCSDEFQGIIESLLSHVSIRVSEWFNDLTWTRSDGSKAALEIVNGRLNCIELK